MVELEREGRVIDGAGDAVAVDRGPAAGNTDLGRAGLETECQVLPGRAQADGGVAAARLVNRHRNSTVAGNAAEGLLRRRVGQLLLLARVKLHLDAQVGRQLRGQRHQRCLTAPDELPGAVDLVGVIGFLGSVVASIDHRGDALDPGAQAGEHAAEIFQDAGVAIIADFAAARGKGNAAEGGKRHGLELGRVVVVKEEFRACAGEADPRVNLQLGHRRQRDLAGSAGVDDVGDVVDKVETGQRARAGDLRQLREVQAEAEFLLEHLVELQVDVQHVAAEREREYLLLRRQAIVIGDAQRLLEDGFDLADGAGRVGGRVFELGQKAINEGEGVGQRSPDHRQDHRIKRLTLDRTLDKFEAQTRGLDDVFEREFLEVERRAKVGQDDDDVVGLDRTAEHQRLDVGRVHRVLVDDLERARMEGVERGDRDLNVRCQRNIGADARVDADAAQAQLRFAREREAQRRTANLVKSKAPVLRVARTGVAIERDFCRRRDVRVGAGTGAARGGCKETDLHTDLEVACIQADTARERNILDAHLHHVLAQGIALGRHRGARSVIECKGVAVATHADHGVLGAVELERVAQHGAVEDEGAVGEQVRAAGDRAGLAEQRAPVEIDKEAEAAFHKHRQTALRAGGKRELLTAKIQIQRFAEGGEFFAEFERHAERALHRVEHHLQARGQHPRSVHRHHELLQRRDLHAQQVHHRLQPDALRRRIVEHHLLAVDNGIDAIGA